jgi:hypothetical protein
MIKLIIVGGIRMLCNKCGYNSADNTLTSCPNCSSPYVVNTSVVQQPVQVVNQPVQVEIEEPKKGFDFNKFALIFLLLVIVGAVVVMVTAIKGDLFYFSEKPPVESNEAINEVIDVETETKYEAVSKSGQDGIVNGKGETSVIFDNQYLEQTILNSTDEVKFFIGLDKDNNKRKCSDEIKEIEERIESNYGILAVNFCELDIDFARELEGVAGYIYNNYPTARDKLTNITIANVDKNATYMAAFMPIFTFVTSSTSSQYPLGIKTQIILNAKYFLNTSKIESSVSYGAKSGYFPPNATRSSAVAHEFGHYLSYVAMMNYYKADNLTFVKTDNAALLMDVYNDFSTGDFSNKVIKEAYKVYTNNYGGTLDYTGFRESISKYAVAKNGNGAYIYDETIAEAFHDCYLNGDNAQLASKLIIETLLSYL